MQAKKADAAETQSQKAALASEQLKAQAAQDRTAEDSARQVLVAKAAADLEACNKKWQTVLAELQQQADADKNKHSSQLAASQERAQADRLQLLQKMMQKAQVGTNKSMLDVPVQLLILPQGIPLDHQTVCPSQHHAIPFACLADAYQHRSPSFEAAVFSQAPGGACDHEGFLCRMARKP